MDFFSIDEGFDDMEYGFCIEAPVPTECQGEFMLWCAVIYQWVEDLSSSDDYAKRQAWAWLGTGNMRFVCNFIGLNPEVLTGIARKKRWVG
jgi:hypothetical protein